MKEKLESLLRQSQVALNRAGVALGHARTAVSHVRTALHHGWRSHAQSWTSHDWLAGIQPLPRDMASHLAAIAMVTALCTTSIIYGEEYHRQFMLARAMASGEHLLDTNPLPEAAPATPAQPVPEAAIPGASSAPAARPQLPQIGEAFIDRFEGEVLSDHWYISHGWSNGDHMDNDWQQSQVSVEPDGLTLTMEKAPVGHSKPLVSAEVQVQPVFRYGYFEVTMKVPRGSGLVTGVFTYIGLDEPARSNEIDIEILGRDTRVLEATIHENGRSTLKRIALPFDSADGFHTFGIDWRPESISWYADGKKLHTESGPVARRVTHPQKFIIDFWGSTQLRPWVGPFDRSKAPWKLVVSCVAYSPTYTGTLCD